MNTLHFDCFAGISGDMALGAFVDLGVDPQELGKELDKLGLSGWSLDFVRDERNNITGTRAVVKLSDHHEHHHDHEHHHSHEHHHDHHSHAHNSWKEIKALIERSGLSDGVKKRALDIFSRIAACESRVHGVPEDEIAYHEVGALDSIIDIVGAAVCLDILKPDRVTSGAIELGGGTVQCAHGILPVPAPATLLLVQGLPVKAGGFDKEMTTPTGAAILASCVDEFITGPVSYREIKTGTGIGTRKLDKPNVLRVSWRETEPDKDGSRIRENLLLMETNIDDMSGEALGFLMERLFEGGALDVVFIPCCMKKSRPGTVVSVLCRPETSALLGGVLFRHSTAIGYREIPLSRVSLPREERRLAGDFGEAREKIIFSEGRSKIEFEDRARLARERNLTLDEAEALIRRAAPDGSGGNHDRS
ncbi:MAG: nickel pincer cofactor biosynthesis protein LarC [Spirochaetaceae bacterium]|nr:nickel pincer cofactor biosynthesis protein LarC [Spirochaetaceae bacterium]